MELKMNLTFDEDKLRELVAEAVARLKAEGYIWRDDNGKELLGREDGSSSKQAD